MIMRNFFNFRPSAQLQRYKKWRETGMKLNHQIMEQAPQDAILRAADDLRLRKKNHGVCFDSQVETHFLMDRVVHDIPVNGKRLIELYRDQNIKTLTADERKLLDALVDSCYSLFIVQRIEADQGLHLTDVFSNKEIFLVDMHLSRTAVKGHLLAARAISLDGITFTSGCACPFPAEYLPQLRDNFVHLFEKKKPQMTWAKMRHRYNPFFFITMKQLGMKIDFGDVV